MKHTITCVATIEVYQILGYEEDGKTPITTSISTIIEDAKTLEVTDEEYQVISDAFSERTSEYDIICLDDLVGCEKLYSNVIDDLWQRIVDEYKRIGLESNNKQPYHIDLPNDRFIEPFIRVLPVGIQQLEFNFELMPDKSVLRELPNGSLELVTAGRDFPFTARKVRGCMVEPSFPLGRIERVGDRAFFGCTEIMYLSLPNCKSIGEYAFSGCGGLRTAQLPMLECIEDGTFNDCHFLTDFTYPEHLYKVGTNAFYGCMHLKHFTKYIDAGVEEVTSLPQNTKVGDDAFAYTPLEHLSNNPIYE